MSRSAGIDLEAFSHQKVEEPVDRNKRSDDDEIEKVFSHPEGRHSDLKVFKLITDAGLSLVDVITDLLFAIR